MQSEHIICTLPELIYPPLRYGDKRESIKNILQIPTSWRKLRSPKLKLHFWFPYIPPRTWPDLQDLQVRSRKEQQTGGFGPPVLNLLRASWSFPGLYTSEMSLEWKPSFNLEFNKNWLRIAEHKERSSINLPALFVLGRKQVLSAEADDRCWLKDKYYLYFCTRFLLLHILSCMGIWSTKKWFGISQARSHVLPLHGDGFKEFIQA